MRWLLLAVPVDLGQGRGVSYEGICPVLGTGTARLCPRAHLHWDGHQISDANRFLPCQSPTLLYSPLFLPWLSNPCKKKDFQEIKLGKKQFR